MPGGVRTIDARGLYILPGGVDTHTHMNMPFMGTTTCDDFYSGTKAALAGGTTTIMDFVLPPKGVGLVAAFKKWNEWAKDNACCDYTFRVAIPEFKKGKTDVEMESLVKEFGVNSFKCFMAYKGDLMLSDEELIGVFDKCRELGAIALVHAENGDIIDYNVKKLKSQGVSGPEGHLQSRPEEVEAEATSRAIVLANQVNCPLYVVHVMSRSAADVLASARNRGCLVFGEAITAGFGTDGSHYFDRNWRVAAAHVLSPPLRTDQTTSEHLINLLASGQLQTTGSDHCTFNTEQKELGAKDFSKIPNGVNGVEERLVILWEKAVKTGILDVKQFVAVTSTNAAKTFNIYPRKGRLAKGSDADILIWGPKSQTISAKTHHSNVDFNIFEGMHVSSGPQVVISNGKVVLDESGFHVTQGMGRLLSCPPNSQYVYGAINTRAKLSPIKVDRSGKAPVNEMAPPPLPLAAASGGPAAAPSSSVNGSEHPKLSDLNTLAAMSVHDSQEVSPTSFYKGTTRSGVRNLQVRQFGALHFHSAHRFFICLYPTGFLFQLERTAD